MSVTLETLELTPEELQRAREAVQKLAYFLWLEAGCPSGCDRELWVRAEQDWIAHSYVPDRTLDGTRRPLEKLSAASTAHGDDATQSKDAAAGSSQSVQHEPAHATA